MKKEIIIGIDPDKDKSGVATLDITDGQKILMLESMGFPDLTEYISMAKTNVESLKVTGHEVSLKVFIEASWTTTAIWHLSRGDKPQIAAKKGYSVGENHMTGKLIVQMLERAGVEVVLCRPFQKIWKGDSRKITHTELTKELESYGVRLLPFENNRKRSTNQEERDAALMALYNA